jgi:ribosome-binding factor A
VNNRIEKINELIKQKVSDIILKDLSLKEGVFVTITKVDTTPDLRYTRVFISVFPDSEIAYVEKTLRKEIYKLQGKLNRVLHMKPLPKLEFRFDFTEVRADEIEKILREI